MAGIEEILREFEYGTTSLWLVWLFFCWLIYSARHRRQTKPFELNLRLYRYELEDVLRLKWLNPNLNSSTTPLLKYREKGKSQLMSLRI